MKQILTLLSLLFTICLTAQDLEVEGKAKINNLQKDNEADSMLVILPDGTVGVRDVSSLQDMINQSILNFGLAQGQKGIMPLLVYGYSIQNLLDAGVSPMDFLFVGIPTDSLYGKTYQGGLLFYLDDLDTIPGVKGMVAAPSDQSSEAEWGCFSIIIAGADGQAVGSGEQNTLDIEAGCAEVNIAAELCVELILDGFDDWFLPSKDELNLMYNNLYLAGFGGFAAAFYWSSTEGSSSSARGQNFNTGGQFSVARDLSIRVRAVRAF